MGKAALAGIGKVKSFGDLSDIAMSTLGRDYLEDSSETRRKLAEEEERKRLIALGQQFQTEDERIRQELLKRRGSDALRGDPISSVTTPETDVGKSMREKEIKDLQSEVIGGLEEDTKPKEAKPGEEKKPDAVTPVTGTDMQKAAEKALIKTGATPPDSTGMYDMSDAELEERLRRLSSVNPEFASLPAYKQLEGRLPREAARAGVTATLGQEKRTTEMHPLDMAGKTADTDKARQSIEVMKGELERLKTLMPAEHVNMLAQALNYMEQSNSQRIGRPAVERKQRLDAIDELFDTPIKTAMGLAAVQEAPGLPEKFDLAESFSNIKSKFRALADAQGFVAPEKIDTLIGEIKDPKGQFINMHPGNKRAVLSILEDAKKSGGFVGAPAGAGGVSAGASSTAIPDHPLADLVREMVEKIMYDKGYWKKGGEIVGGSSPRE